MWIEIIGLPGVGKTTMIESNISTIKKNYRVVESRSPSIFERFIAKVLYFFYYQYKIKNKSLARKLSYRHSFRFCKKKKANLFFYDSGMLQVLLENLIETNFEHLEEKLNLLAKIPLPHHIIHISDKIDEIVLRETKRPESRFNLSVEETKKRYEQALTIIEKELLQAATFTDTISVHNPKKFAEVLKHEKTF